MFGFVLQIPTSLPQTVWACKTKVSDYSWQNKNSSDMIELCISSCEERTVCVKGNDPLTLRGKHFTCLVGDLDVKSHAQTGVEVDLISIAVRFDNLVFTAKELDETDLYNTQVLLLPYNSDLILKNDLNETERLINRFIHAYMKKTAASLLECYSIFFDLLSKLDTLTRRSLSELNAQGNGKDRNKYINYYVMKADSIINRSYQNKITLEQTAKEFGITPSYLSMIYKRSMGVSFSQRLFEIRITKAKQLLTESSLSVSQIAELTGLGDESNLRKRFKQFYGISIREYKSISKEQTLYHKKPLRNG